MISSMNFAAGTSPLCLESKFGANPKSWELGRDEGFLGIFTGVRFPLSRHRAERDGGFTRSIELRA